MKKRSKPKRQNRLQAFLEGIGYMLGATTTTPIFPEVKAPEKMIREAWENAGDHIAKSMDAAAEEHHLSVQ